jgi:ATP-dependent DNA ligase
MPMPRPPVEVMLARAVATVPSASALPGGVLYEQKWDGYRLVAFNASPQPYLQSRRGADLTGGFPEIAEAVATLPRVVLHGELVIWGVGALDFLLQRMASRGANARQLGVARPANYVVFDILAVGGEDLRREPLRTSRRQLQELLTEADPSVVLAPRRSRSRRRSRR